ncbi:hypothetical protein AB4Z54_12855, partial [Streptomyces sp. MCAF7]
EQHRILGDDHPHPVLHSPPPLVGFSAPSIPGIRPARGPGTLTGTRCDGVAMGPRVTFAREARR